MDRGAWRATAHGVMKHRTQLSDCALSISESLCYTPDTNTTLKRNSTPIKTEKECSCRFLGVECKLLGWKKQNDLG